MENYDDTINEARKIIEYMDPAVKDCVYRIIWEEHVKEDVESVLEGYIGDKIRDLSDEEYNCFVSDIAQRYTSGHYDCNLSYWDNLDNLIDEAIIEMAYDKEM